MLREQLFPLALLVGWLKYFCLVFPLCLLLRHMFENLSLPIADITTTKAAGDAGQAAETTATSSISKLDQVHY